MGLYDIFDEIAAKQVTKSDMGDNRIAGVVVGIVAKNYDAQMPGRVCVQIPVRDSEKNELKWARVAMLSGGKEWGHYFMPEVGDQVLVIFEQGNIEKPYIIGCVSKATDKFLSRSADTNNNVKKIVTRNGNTIEFDDVQDETGNKDKISIYTGDKTHKVILDNEKEKITISDKDEKNKLVINSGTGNVDINASSKLTIKVGENLQLIMNGDSGTITVKGDKIKFEATENVKVNSNSGVAITGGNVKVAASSSLKLESSAMASVKGSPVKIG